LKVTSRRTESRKTAGHTRSLKQFSHQSLPKSLQILRRCYRWRKTVPSWTDLSGEMSQKNSL